MITQTFWSGKKVFLTGHTGFKGSWLSLWLQSLGASVTGFALAPPMQPNLFELARVAENMQSIIGDVRDLNLLQKTLQNAKPDIVIHMAAQPLVQYSYDFPVETYATNIMGTVHLLESVRHCSSAKVVVNVTSDKCYDNKEWDWGYRENEPLGGYDPYSSSKGCAELVTAAYRNSFFNPKDYQKYGKALASARAGNVIGGGDWGSNRLVPDIVTAFIAGKPALIRNPLAIRPWQHVLEPLYGYMLLAEKLWHDPEKFSQGWNFGPQEQDVKSVAFIADYMANLWGYHAVWQQDTAVLPHEARLLKLDIAKAKNYLGWLPQMNLEQALNYVTEWYKAWQQNKDMRAVTLQQIDAYQRLINQYYNFQHNKVVATN